MKKIITAVMAVMLVTCGLNRIDGTADSSKAKVTGKLYEFNGKEPAKSATVIMRLKNTLANTSQLSLAKKLINSASTTTDENGLFMIDIIDTGLYSIEGSSTENTMVLIDSVKIASLDSTKILTPDTLKPAGAIRGVIKLANDDDPRKVLVLIFGSDRSALVDTQGNFSFAKLAEGKYTLRFLPSLQNYNVLDTGNINVLSGDTSNLDTIMLPFTGLPDPKGLNVSYDTLHQVAIITWDKIDTLLIDGFNVYRSVKGQNFSLITQSPLPATATQYRDSTVVVRNTYEYRVVSRNVSGLESQFINFPNDTVKAVSSSLVTTAIQWNLFNVVNDTGNIFNSPTFCVSYSNQTRKISKISWYIDSFDSLVKTKVDSSLQGRDTLVFRFGHAGNHKIYLKIVDVTGTAAIDSQSIIIIASALAVDAGDSITTYFGSVITLHGVATDRFGTIVKYEWDFDGSGTEYTWKQTGNGDATFKVDFSDAWAYFRVTENVGNDAFDSVHIRVFPRQIMLWVAGHFRSVSLRWTKCPDNDFLNYRLIRKQGSNGTIATIATLGQVNDTTYIDSNLADTTKYFYTIESVDRTGLFSSATDSAICVPSGAWKTNQPSPILFGNGQGTAVNGIIYMSGDGLSQSANLYEYNPAIDKWKVVKTLPDARWSGAACTVNGKAYFIGGATFDCCTHNGSYTVYHPSVLEYDPVLNSVTKKSSMPTKRRGFAACVFNGKILTFGGGRSISDSSQEEEYPLSVIEQYDPATDTWTSIGAMPIARLWPACASIGNYIYITGGTTDSTKSRLDRYNPSDNTWSSMPNMPAGHTAYYAAVGAAIGTMFIVFGGSDDANNEIKDVNIFETTTNQWRNGSSMPVARSGGVAVTIDPIVYILGGTPIGPEDTGYNCSYNVLADK